MTLPRSWQLMAEPEPEPVRGPLTLLRVSCPGLAGCCVVLSLGGTLRAHHRRHHHHHHPVPLWGLSVCRVLFTS